MELDQLKNHIYHHIDSLNDIELVVFGRFFGIITEQEYKETIGEVLLDQIRYGKAKQFVKEQFGLE